VICSHARKGQELPACRRSGQGKPAVHVPLGRPARTAPRISTWHSVSGDPSWRSISTGSICPLASVTPDGETGLPPIQDLLAGRNPQRVRLSWGSKQLESRSPGGRAHCLMSEDPRGRCRLARSCAHILGASTTCPGRESPTVEVCRSRAIHLGESGRSPGMGARPGGCTKGAVPGDGVRDGGGTAARGGKPEHKPLSPWPAEWGQQVSGAALWARPQSTAT